jgi:hypothetical protein
MVYPLSLGKTIITVTTLDGNKTAKCDLEVIKRVPVTGIEQNTIGITLGIGQSEKLIARVLPSNASNQNVIWSSDNTSVASVDNNGFVTAISEGITIIWVVTEEGNFKAGCEVNCINFNLPIVISLEPAIIDIGPQFGDAKVALSGFIADIGDPPYTERGFIYTVGSDDPLTPHPMGPGTTTAIVTGNGLGDFVKEVILNKSFGKWTIRAYAKSSMGTSYGDMVTISF